MGLTRHPSQGFLVVVTIVAIWSAGTPSFLTVQPLYSIGDTQHCGLVSSAALLSL